MLWRIQFPRIIMDFFKRVFWRDPKCHGEVVTIKHITMESKIRIERYLERKSWNGNKKREVIRIDPTNQKKNLKTSNSYVLIIYMQLTYLQGVFKEDD